jgi:hypothetical protein
MQYQSLFVLLAGSKFVGFSSLPGEAGAVARLINDASLMLDNCTVTDNNATDSVGVIYLDKGTKGPSRVAVRGGRQSQNAPEPLIAKHSVGFAYASPPLDVLEQYKNRTGPAKGIEEMRPGTFASGEDDAFKSIRDVRISCRSVLCSSALHLLLQPCTLEDQRNAYMHACMHALSVLMPGA